MRSAMCSAFLEVFHLSRGEEKFQANTKNSSNCSNGGKINASGYKNLRQRAASPSHRILRNSEGSIGMRTHSNGARVLISPYDRAEKRSGAICRNKHSKRNNNHNNDRSCQNDQHGGGSVSPEAATNVGKKGCGGEAIASVWPPKFAIALSNKEKEEDFLVIKGSKLPQRPKKRAKIIQRTVNLVCPGTWLGDLTLDRYEVRQKKISSKKRPRGLKAMSSNVDSDSE